VPKDENQIDIFNELVVIDRFEERFGNQESVRRACDVMVSYLSAMTRPFNEIAERGLRAAIKCREGSIAPNDLESERRSISDFLRERSARTDYDTPEYCIVHAVEAILWFYRDPSWGGGASEAMSNFLVITDQFESNYSLLKRLLEQKFATD
jgi:hypothetical protein